MNKINWKKQLELPSVGDIYRLKIAIDISEWSFNPGEEGYFENLWIVQSTNAPGKVARIELTDMKNKEIVWWVSLKFLKKNFVKT